MEKQNKRRRGDRRDAVLVRGLDSMHTVMICMMPNRADNEAYVKETIDLRNLEAYLEKRNAEGPEHHFKLAAVLVICVLPDHGAALRLSAGVERTAEGDGAADGFYSFRVWSTRTKSDEVYLCDACGDGDVAANAFIASAEVWNRDGAAGNQDVAAFISIMIIVS